MLDVEMQKLIVLGAGGHASVVIEAAQAAWPDVEILVFDEAPKTERILDLPISQGRPDPVNFDTATTQAIVAIGNNQVRATLTHWLEDAGFKLATVIHPTAWVSPSASIEQGSFVSARAVINARAKIGAACIINTAAVVEHDCMIKKSTHICPSATLAGAVKIGSQTTVGANSTIRELVSIADNITIGAGSVVIRNITEAGTYAGCPVKQL